MEFFINFFCLFCWTLGGNVQRMDPLYMIQIAVKNNVGVSYFSVNVPPKALFMEDGKMGKTGRS